jgi:DNA invertase Pin-like site-specific DNA recombinase
MTTLSSCTNVLQNQNECQHDFAMKIGYARVSTQEQDNQAQITALHQAGCERVFQEKASGGRWDRPELHRLMGK